MPTAPTVGQSLDNLPEEAAMRLGSRPVSPYRLYLGLQASMSFLLGICYATIMVYWVTAGRLNPLQLLLLGTALELSYFVFQLPTGVLADLVSRRLCVLAGLVVTGLGLVIQGLSPAFGNLVFAALVIGLGAALNDGAEQAWIAGELGEEQITGTYLRATQLGLLGTIAGSLLSGVLALAGLNVPLLVGGSLMCLLAGFLAVVMPERNFRRPAGPVRVGSIASQARGHLVSQIRSARRAIVVVPGLVLLFGMTLFAGLWSESFDRLWGAFLLRDTRFPAVGGLHPAMWFSLLGCVVAAASLGSTELARRRTQRLGPDSVVGALLAVTLAIGAAVVIMATAHSFAVAVAAYLAVSVLRPVSYPLVSGWIVGRIEPSVRATVLSARDMFDSGGQIIAGPVIGAIGTLASIRVALLAGAAALGPAAACLAAASRRLRPQPSVAVTSEEIAGLAGPGLPG
jgi:MFS transporter, DHA3 family, tetracycline resistance protein